MKTIETIQGGIDRVARAGGVTEGQSAAAVAAAISLTDNQAVLNAVAALSPDTTAVHAAPTAQQLSTDKSNAGAATQLVIDEAAVVNTCGFSFTSTLAFPDGANGIFITNGFSGGRLAFGGSHGIDGVWFLKWVTDHWRIANIPGTVQFDKATGAGAATIAGTYVAGTGATLNLVLAPTV
jgi:hypothetical protein